MKIKNKLLSFQLVTVLVLVVVLSSLLVYERYDRRLSYSKSSAAGAEVSLNNASSWAFNFSTGVPSRPLANPGGGWYFDIPVMNGTESQNCYKGSKTCPSVNMVVTPYTSPLIQEHMRMTVQVTTTGSPVFNHKLGDSGNTCPTPASARFYIQKKGDNYVTDLQRWWSNPVNFVIKAGSPTVISAPLKPDQWSSVFGSRGSDNATSLNGFKSTLSNPGVIGLTFGGGCFFGHGVNVSNGTARFTVSNFALTNTPPVVAPSYGSSGIVNSASYSSSLSKDGLVSIFGTNLTSNNCTQTVSFVDTACEVKVLVNNVPQKLSYVSSGQINFLLPNLTGNLALVVQKSGVSGPSVSINVLDSAPALFSSNSSGKGLVNAQHWSNPKYTNGTPLSLTNPLENKGTFVVYLTGLGSYRTGLGKKPTVKINNVIIPASAITYADKTSPGLDQINIANLDFANLNITTGTKVYPIVVCGGSACSQSLDLPIKK